MAEQPVNVSPSDGATDVSVTPLLVIVVPLNTIDRAFVEQYNDVDGSPHVVGWDNDTRRRKV